MFLRKLNLFHFKNIEEAQLEFQRDVICLLGKNGSGKTNLLDAIHYLSFTKSAVNPSDAQNIQQGHAQFIDKGEFDMDGRAKEVVCSYQTGQKKIIREDGQDCAKFSEHVGKYPVVLIAPQDIELIWDGSELRRKFFDTLISQLDKVYLENLITYVNHLKQRNSLLRTFSENGKIDHDLLAGYDQKLIPAAHYIYAARKQFTNDFLPFFMTHYTFLCESNEQVSIRYRSDLESEDFAQWLQKNLQRDIMLQRTSNGIHRDDFDFLMNGNEVKKFGSQGQQKSFLIALKLAEFQSIADKKQFKPILLLDDVFDKLDDHRIRQLILLVSRGTFGQLFITDARPGRSHEVLKEATMEAQIFKVENGTFRHG